MRKGYTVQLDPSLHKAMKLKSCEANKRISDWIEDACRMYLRLAQEAEKQGKSLKDLVAQIYESA